MDWSPTEMLEIARSASTTGQAQFETAKQYLAGGVNASARINTCLDRPFFATRAAGGHVWDQDGRDYIDLSMSHGASLLGHGHPAVKSAVEAALALGVMCSFETQHQVDVARRITELVPSAELVRFTTSGTETTWHAIRTARAFTGRRKVVKFEGHFHGYNDVLGFSVNPPVARETPGSRRPPFAESAGMDPGAADSVIVLPWNDIEAFETAIAQDAESIAAVIMEPVNYDCYTITPDLPYLRRVRELTREHAIVLIFDEILSGFRTGPGCAQAYYGVIPDLCTLGKSLGGGLPLSAFVGRRDVMESVAPVGRAIHSGTYNAHLVPVAAAAAFLSEISRSVFWEDLAALETFFYSGLQEIFISARLPVIVQAVGARFSLLFGLDEPLRNYRQTLSLDKAMAQAFYRRVYDEGVYFHPSPHHGFSAMHTHDDLAQALTRIERAVRNLGPVGRQSTRADTPIT